MMGHLKSKSAEMKNISMSESVWQAKQTSTYVGAYTEELYNLLLRNAREAREIRKELRGGQLQI